MYGVESIAGWISNWRTILPIPILSLFSGAVLLAECCRCSQTSIVRIARVGFLGALISLLWIPENLNSNPFFVVDRLSVAFLGLIFATAEVIVLLLESHCFPRLQEYCFLLLAATLGSSLLVMSHHFIPFVLGLEILSVSLYGMIAYQGEKQSGIEAGTKYLVLAGMSSAFILFGISFFYASKGSLEFSPVNLQSLDLLALILIGVGVSFKLALAPFHMWSPDIYEGAPPLTVAFLATVSKGAVFIAFYRMFWKFYWLPPTGHFVEPVASFLAVMSMGVGNLLAFHQSNVKGNVKRILAYSSVGHLGFFLVAMLAGEKLGFPAVIFYWISYFLAILSAFGVISLLSNAGQKMETIEDYEGLFWTSPILATVFSLSLFSLAGIPLTAGFVAKFYLISAGIEASLWALIIVLIMVSVLGIAYYLRVIGAIFRVSERDLVLPQERPMGAPLGTTVVAGLALISVWLGIYPTPVLSWVSNQIMK